MSEQSEIHDMTFSVTSDRRIRAAKQLVASFNVLTDRRQALFDLLRLCSDEDNTVREVAINSLAVVFPELSYEGKEALWDNLLELATESNDMKVREQAVRALGAFFLEIPDEMKDEALDELLELVVSESSEIQKEVLLALPPVISHIVDKERTWKDIMRLTRDESGYVRRKAADALSSIFPDVPNKEVVWTDFLSLTKAKDEYVRKTATDTLSKVFAYVSDKNEAYSDLVILANKRDNYILREIVRKLAVDYPQFYKEYERIGRKWEEMNNDKQLKGNGVSGQVKPVGVHELSSGKNVNVPEEAVRSQDLDEKLRNWSEVLTMAEDRDTGVRRNAVDLLTRIFPDVKERPGVFFDLVKLTESQDALIREKAAELFPIAYKYSDEKQRAWDELTRLSSAVDRKVRREAVLTLSSGYAEVPDKDKAWKDLVKLSDHSDSFVKRAATRALGNVFFLAPDKTESWRDLQKVTANPYNYGRKYAFRSLGRASLWRSLRAENETTYIFGIKEAVRFFKESNEVPTDTNIPDLYQPFYEALLSILFSEIPGIARMESERYVSKLSHEIRISGDSLQFHEIINQLAELLKNAVNLPSGDLSAQKKLLETSIRTFEKFSHFFEIKEEEAISSSKTVKKEHPKPGKEILERVERRKSFLSKRL